MNTSEQTADPPKSLEKISQKSFGPDADAFLEKFYSPYNISTTRGKIKILEDKLGGPSNFYGLGGEVNDNMKLACLECEFLERQGVIKLTLA